MTPSYFKEELLSGKPFKKEPITVEGYLDLRGCTSLKSLPDNLTVKGNLYLTGCTSLTSLPDNLTVEGNLYLTGCTSLTSLPDNLTVEGDLYLGGCTSLTSLPKNLTVTGSLYLYRCTSLQFKGSLGDIKGEVHVDVDQMKRIPQRDLPKYLSYKWVDANIQELYRKRLTGEID